MHFRYIQIHTDDTCTCIHMHTHTCAYIPPTISVGTDSEGGFEVLLQTHATPVLSATYQYQLGRVSSSQDGLVECPLRLEGGEGPWAAHGDCSPPPPPDACSAHTCAKTGLEKDP